MIIEFGNRYFYWNEEKTKSAFYEASDRKHTVIRWMVIVLLIVMGAGILALNLDDLRAYEKAVEEPILVDGEISVVDEGWWSESYVMYLTYSYDGVEYEGVPYRSSKNPETPKRAGEKVTVSLDHRNHGQLARNILKTGRIKAAIVMLSAGVGLLAYFLALRSEAFRAKREEKASQHTWNKGKPDYVLDTALFVVPVLVFIELGMGIIFPAAFGIGPFVATAVTAFAGTVLHFALKISRKRHG